MKTNTKINILFPYNSVGGAFRSTYEICNRLTKRGYDIVVYFPLIPIMENKNIFSIEGLKFFIRGLIFDLQKKITEFVSVKKKWYMGSNV